MLFIEKILKNNQKLFNKKQELSDFLSFYEFEVLFSKIVFSFLKNEKVITIEQKIIMETPEKMREDFISLNSCMLLFISSEGKSTYSKQEMIKILSKISSLKEFLFISLFVFIHRLGNNEIYEKNKNIFEKLLDIITTKSNFKFESQEKLNNFNDFVKEMLDRKKLNSKKWKQFNDCKTE